MLEFYILNFAFWILHFVPVPRHWFPGTKCVQPLKHDRSLHYPPNHPHQTVLLWTLYNLLHYHRRTALLTDTFTKPCFFPNPIQTLYFYILVSSHAAAVTDTIFTSWGCPLTRAFTVFAGKKYQFQMCRTDFTTWITETQYTHWLQVRYIPSFLAVQLCTLCHHYLVFLYMWLSVVAVILSSFVFCLILVILLSAPKSKSTKKLNLLLPIKAWVNADSKLARCYDWVPNDWNVFGLWVNNFRTGAFTKFLLQLNNKRKKLIARYFRK